MCLATVYTTPEEFENGSFTLKIQMRRRITAHFGFVFDEKTRSVKSRDYCEVIVFKKLPCFHNVSRKHGNETAGVFKFLRFKKRFQKASFSRWISVDGTTAYCFLRCILNAAVQVMTFSTSLGANSSMKSTDSLAGNVPIFGVILNTPLSSRVRVTCDDVTEGCTGTPGGTGHSKNGL